MYNPTYNKILDWDWFCARLFDAWLARNHVGVQLLEFKDNFL